MARSLPNLPMTKLNFLPASFTFLVVFSVFTVVIFLCGAHKAALKSLRGKEEKQQTVRLGGKSSTNTPMMIKKMKSGLSSKALVMAKMISWRKVVDEGEAAEVFEFNREDGEDGVVWKKKIIKGERCRPLDFSGKILYDSDGNLLPE